MKLLPNKRVEQKRGYAACLFIRHAVCLTK